MRFSEAMALLEQGKRVRKTNWEEFMFIHISEDGDIVDENCMYVDVNTTVGEWEEYIEGKDINVATKIEELKSEDVNNRTLEEALGVIGNKINEVIRYINSKEK